MKLNKKGISILDVTIAMAILAILTLLYYGGLTAYYKYTTRAENSVYTTYSLTECAEVVHSIRYGEWDKSGTAGWEIFASKYPSGLYILNYDNAARTRSMLPIYKNIATQDVYINFKDMLISTGYTPNTMGESFNVGVVPKTVPMRRYVYINNNTPDKTTVQCYVKYYDPYFVKQFGVDENDFFNYEELKFIMTNYN